MSDFPFGLAAGVWTALSMALFIGVVIWAYSKSNRSRFEEAARLALEEVQPRPRQDAEGTKNTEPEERRV